MAETNKGQIQDVEDKIILSNTKIDDINTKFDTLQTYLNNRLENVTNSLVTISTEHTAIHKGYAYIANAIIPSLVFGGKVIFNFITPLTLFPHIKGLSVSLAGATCKASIIEDSTILTGGVIQDIIHRLNINSSIESDSEIYLGATYSGGKAHDTVVIHGSTSVNGKETNSNSFIPTDYFEYILKNGNANYIFEIENICPDENTAYNIQVRLFFYEEPIGIET